ncbi:tetratricopeptide repeat protein [Vicingaceae bacterium]|nr:tetratricopeptide repeat protein [Vicingaceae bacterium]MDB4060763.1 tetratricopeptide repeat protein [Vicingaceae bacterium]
MKILKALFLSFLAFILLSFSSSSQEVLPDSLVALTESSKLSKKATGYQKSAQFFFKANDSVQYKNALQSFNQLPLEDLSDTFKRELVRAHSSFLANSFQHAIARQFLPKLIDDAREQSDFESKALFHQLLAPHYFYSFQYDSSNFHLDKAIALYSKLNITQEIGNVTIKKSGISYAKGDYEIAIKYAYEAIEIFKETGNKEKLAVAYLQLGNILYFQDDFYQSMQYYELSLSAFKANENDEGIYRALSNIGLVNLMIHNYKKSISQQLESIQYFTLKNKELEAKIVCVNKNGVSYDIKWKSLS